MVFRALTMILVMFLLLGLYKWRIHQEEKFSFENRIALPEPFKKAETKITQSAMLKFVIDEEFAPPLPKHQPKQELARIVFKPEDYDEKNGWYQKSVQHIEGKLEKIKAEFSNEDYSSLYVVIVNPEKKDWAFYGRLLFDTGDPEIETETLDDNHRAWVVAQADQKL